MYLTILVIVLFAVLGVSFGSRLVIEMSQPDAIVIATEVTLNSEPEFDATTDINLSSGTLIKLLDEQGDWIKLSTAGDAVRGWVPASAVESISLDAVKI